MSGADNEILTAQPGGPRPRRVLEESKQIILTHLQNGIALRTLYHHSAQFDEATKDYVRAVELHGGKTRTLPEFFERMIIIDRRVAFIPADAKRSSAIRVESPPVVNFLADVFERTWILAKPFPFTLT